MALYVPLGHLLGAICLEPTKKGLPKFPFHWVQSAWWPILLPVGICCSDITFLGIIYWLCWDIVITHKPKQNLNMQLLFLWMIIYLYRFLFYFQVSINGDNLATRVFPNKLNYKYYICTICCHELFSFVICLCSYYHFLCKCGFCNFRSDSTFR